MRRAREAIISKPFEKSHLVKGPFSMADLTSDMYFYICKSEWAEGIFVGVKQRPVEIITIIGFFFIFQIFQKIF